MRPSSPFIPFTPFTPFTLGAAAFLLAGCNMLSLDPTSKTRPATEETAVGTWRNAEPELEGRTVRMTLVIDGNHTMIWARRVSGVVEGRDWEYRRENWTWEVADGKLKAVKTSCEYADAEGESLAQADCRAPVTYEIPIVVNGNAWRITEGDKAMLFRKD